MSYQRWRGETIGELARHGVSYDDAVMLLRNATSLKRSSEIQCSIDVGEKEMARLERRDAACMRRVREWAAEWEHPDGSVAAASVAFQFDPRGCPITVMVEHLDGYATVSIPGRGLPARCFA